ncbi:hypothetical protein ABK040_009122 [Willaertia magna]
MNKQLKVRTSSSALLLGIQQLQTRNFHNSNTLRGDEDDIDWSSYLSQSLTNEEAAAETTSSQDIFNIILEKDPHADSLSSSSFLQSLLQGDSEQKEKQEQENELDYDPETPITEVYQFIQEALKTKDVPTVGYPYKLKISKEQYEENVKQVEEELKQKLDGLKPEELDKLYWDIKLANAKKKEKALSSGKVVLEDFQTPTQLETERMQMDAIFRLIRRENEKNKSLSPKEAKINALTTSYLNYLKDLKKQANIEMEKEKKQHMYNVLKTQADKNPESFETFSKEFLSKKSISHEFILEQYANGFTTEEITLKVLSEENPLFAQPSYASDPYESIRPIMQKFIENRQEYLRGMVGIKTGRRHGTGFVVYGDRSAMDVKYKDNPTEIIDRVHAIRDKNRYERTLINLHKRGTLTKAEKEKRRERTGKRRYEGQKLDNTMKVFMWVKKYRGKMLK